MANNVKLVPKIQREFYKRLSGKPIAYHPHLSRMLGSINAGILMSQLLYWISIVAQMGRGNFYKSIKELEEETGLTRKQQDNAIKLCEQKGVIKHWVHMAEGKPTRHFSINIGKLKEVCLGLPQSDKLSSDLETIGIVPEGQNNTENITDKITDNETINKFRLNKLKRDAFSNSLIGKQL